MQAQYWCYVVGARRDMAPKEFQEFLGALGTLPAAPTVQGRPHTSPAPYCIS